MNWPGPIPKSALVCALDWGLGHVARTTALVGSLLVAGTRVVLASNGRSATWWRSEFPDLEVRELPDYGVRYAKGPWLVPGLLASLPRIALAIAREKALVARWQREESFDLIFSDNRYGCRAKGARSILMTHQLRLAAPRHFERFEGPGERLVAELVHSFDEVWIPDHQDGIRLSGKMGHPTHPAWFPPLRYIGPLSRFAQVEPDPAWAGPWDAVALVSGPEPARTSFEERLRNHLRRRPGRHLLVRGRPDLPAPATESSNASREVPHLPTPSLASALAGARQILCRGGYSTVMDLSALGLLDSRCVFLPTPGQTEQEYLARHLARTSGCQILSESDLESATASGK